VSFLGYKLKIYKQKLLQLLIEQSKRSKLNIAAILILPPKGLFLKVLKLFNTPYTLGLIEESLHKSWLLPVGVADRVLSNTELHGIST